MDNRIMAESINAVHSGISARTGTGRGVDEAERRIARLDAIANRCRENYVMLQYDIPTAKAAVCPNPSEEMWRHGFRMTLSCWVMPASRLSHPAIVALLAHWRANGCKTHVVEYAESQRAKIEAIARENLEEEVRRVHTALIESIIRADDAVKAAVLSSETAAEQTRAEGGRDSRVRCIIRKAGEQLDAAIACAHLFDETEAVGPLLDGLRNAIAAQRDAFNAKMEAKNGKPVTVDLPPASALVHKPEAPRMGRDAAPQDGPALFELDAEDA